MGLVGIFKQQNFESKHRFETFARGLVRVLTSTTPRSAEFTGSIKYKIRSSEIDDGVQQVKLPERPYLIEISCGDKIIPSADSIPLSVLNHPPGRRLEINFAAYDPPEAAPSPSEGTHSASVLRPNSPLEVLIA